GEKLQIFPVAGAKDDDQLGALAGFPIGIAGLKDASELGRDGNAAFRVHLDLFRTSEPACQGPALLPLSRPFRSTRKGKADRAAATARSAALDPISGPSSFGDRALRFAPPGGGAARATQRHVRKRVAC